MDKLIEIDEIKKRYEAEKQIAPIAFEENKKETKQSTASNLIEHSLGEAVKHKIVTDEKVQGRLLSTADKVIDTAMNVAETEADTADKAAYFKNNTNACDCWGYDEATTKKGFVRAMSTIHDIFTAVWIAIGAITFAPIAFVAKKIQVIVKKTWVAVLLAIFIYLAIVLTPTLLAVLDKI